MTRGTFRRSLRGRLVASMSVAAVGSLLAVTLLHAVAASGSGEIGTACRWLLGDELPEPWQDLAILLPFGVVVVVLVSLVTIWNLRPVTRASEAASRVGPRNPASRIDPVGLPSEIAPLVDAVNGALDRLADAYAAERRFTADAAHELRTPLAALRLRLQRARAEGAVDWPSVDRDLVQLGRLVSQLLELARKETGPPVAGPAPSLPCNLARVAREAAAAVLPLVEEAGRPLVVDIDDALPVAGEADDLRDLLRNLIENALVHGRGRIAVRGRRSAADRVVLDVSDEGDGVPHGSRDAMFDRFRKGSPGGDGSGLGLAIVRAVARRHGAEIGFVDGPGCTVRLTMPALRERADRGAPAPHAPFAPAGRAA